MYIYIFRRYIYLDVRRIWAGGFSVILAVFLVLHCYWLVQLVWCQPVSMSLLMNCSWTIDIVSTKMYTYTGMMFTKKMCFYAYVHIIIVLLYLLFFLTPPPTPTPIPPSHPVGWINLLDPVWKAAERHRSWAEKGASWGYCHGNGSQNGGNCI